MLSLRSARESALFSMREAQGRYKTQYDKKCKQVNFKLGDWIMIRFPHEESGKQRKLSRPWHGPYKEMTQMLLLLRCTSWMRLRYRCIRIGHVMLLLSCHQDSTGMGSPGKIPKWLKRLLADDKKVKETEEEEQHSTDQEGCDGMDQEEGNISQAVSTLEKEADVTVSPGKLEGSTATQGHSYSLRPHNKKNRDDPQ